MGPLAWEPPYDTGVALKKQNKSRFWSSHHGSVITNPTKIHGDVGLIPGITQWIKDPALL